MQEDCSLIAEIANVPQLTYTCPNPPQGVRHFARCFFLIAEIAVRIKHLAKCLTPCGGLGHVYAH